MVKSRSMKISSNRTEALEPRKDVYINGWFPLRIIFLRTGTDRKVSRLVSSRSELMALTP